MAEDSFISLLHRTIDLLNHQGIEYVIIGGVAVDVWGMPRTTNDVDVVIRIDRDSYDDLLEAAENLGFRVDRRKALGQLSQMGMCRIFLGNTSADLIVGRSEFEEEIFKRKRKVTVLDKLVNVASAEDILLYKAFSGREIDLADIRSIIDAQRQDLDVDYVRKRAGMMASRLNRADIVTILERYLPG